MAWAAVGSAAVGVIGSLFGKKKSAPAPAGGMGGFGGLASSFMTAKQGQEMAKARDKAVGMADPFAASRGLANQQLQSLMQTPGSMVNDPAFKFAMDQGLQGVNRSLAAQHFTGSGNAMTELMGYGQGLASQMYNQRLQTLGTMASQGASPTAAAEAELKGTQLSQGLFGTAAAGGLQTLSGAAGGIGSAIGGIGKAVGGLFGGGSSTPDVAGVTPNYGSTGVDMTGFQNPNYSGAFTPAVGGSLDYSTSFGTTPSMAGATSLSGTGLGSMY